MPTEVNWTIVHLKASILFQECFLIHNKASKITKSSNLITNSKIFEHVTQLKLCNLWKLTMFLVFRPRRHFFRKCLQPS